VGGEQYDFAQQVWRKLGDPQRQMKMHVKLKQWDQAIAIANSPENKGKYDEEVFLPYAEWLALNDKFDEALKTYQKAGRPDLSLQVSDVCLTYPPPPEPEPQANTNVPATSQAAKRASHFTGRKSNQASEIYFFACLLAVLYVRVT
jgi:hypothetical protein